MLHRPRQRGGAGVEDQDGRAVGVDELPGRDRIGGISGHGGERSAELRPQFLEQAAIAGDPDDLAPARLKAMAMPRPKPRLAPVTNAVTPAISCPDMTILPGPWFRRRSVGGLLI